MASTSTTSVTPPKSPYITSDEDDDSDNPFFQSDIGLTPDSVAVIIPMSMLMTLFNPYLSVLCKQLFIALSAIGQNILYVDKIRVINALTAETFHFNMFGSAILSKPNLSDNALLSEAYSAHVMSTIIERIFSVKIVNLVHEKDIVYIQPNGPKTDYIFALDPNNSLRLDSIAVEVKRILSKNLITGSPITQHFVNNLLTKTNQAALFSNNSVCERDRWNFQLLHVITDSTNIITFIAQWLLELSEPIGFTRIVVTVVNDGLWLFNNKKKLI